jgi:hypothetical protein
MIATRFCLFRCLPCASLLATAPLAPIRPLEEPSKPVETYAFSRLHLTPEEDRQVARNWDYFSDHLFLQARIRGVRVGSCNMLNPAYVGHLDRPGWLESPLVKREGLICKETSVSLRMKQGVDKVREAFWGTPSLDVICLQECSEGMIELLQKEFSTDPISLFYRKNGGLYDGDKTINNHVVTLVKHAPHIQLQQVSYPILFRRYYRPSPQGAEVLGWDRWRPSVDIRLAVNTAHGSEYVMRLFNIHISSAGQSPARKLARMSEVVSQVKSLTLPDQHVVVMGDTNISSELRRHIPSLSATAGVICLSGQPSQVDNKALVAEDIDAIYYFFPKNSTMHDVVPNCFLMGDPQTAEVYGRTLHPLITKRSTDIRYS